MAQLIDKSALVSEIERLRKNNELKENKHYAQFELDVACGYDMALDDIEASIDTLEVKEVDFDAEWKKYFEYRGNMATVNIKHLAKHFFELGMSVSNKTRKGE